MEKITPTPLNPEKPFAADRATAISEAIPALSSLPLRRAAAIHEAIRTLIKRKGDNFSLVDIIERTRPTAEEQLLKHVTPSQETKPLDERRKIWEQDPQRFAQELARDNERLKKEAERTQRLLEQSGLDVRQIIKAKSPPRDQDFKLSLRELSNLFDPVSGKLIIPASYNLSNSTFAKFYDNYHKVGYFQSEQGRVELRGWTFYAYKEKSNVESKLRVIQEDLDKTLAIVSEYALRRAEISSTRDYLLYLGILDLMKHHSITLFHALTYNERKLEFPQGREEFYKYQQARQQALELMKVSVRMFYQTLFGTDYDQGTDLTRLRQQMPGLVEFIRGAMLFELGPIPSKDDLKDKRKKYAYEKAQLNTRFRDLEVSNPLMIALGASEAVKNDTDMLIGIPSGGTETAIATQLIYELLQGRSPQLIFLPISLHSQLGKKITTADVVTFLGIYYPNLFTDKRILLVDDNSETGHTLGMAAQALVANNAGEISVHLVDFSTRRLTNPKNGAAKATEYYSRPATSSSTLGLTQINEKGEYAHNTKRDEDTRRAKIQSGKRDRW